MGQDPCAVNRLACSEADAWTVDSINETGHLASLSQ
jgi:hypothetical protein